MSKIIFWINSFIPKTVSGYTVVIPKGVHVNKTAIPLPILARLFPTLQNTFKDLNTGYLTDQRGFDDKYGASARMTSVANFDLNTLK